MRSLLRVGLLGAALVVLPSRGSDADVSSSAGALTRPTVFLSTYVESVEDVKNVDNGNGDGGAEEEAPTPAPEEATTEPPEPAPAPSPETTERPQETTAEPPAPTPAPGPETAEPKSTLEPKKTTTESPDETTVEPKSTSTKSSDESTMDPSTAKPNVDPNQKSTTEPPDEEANPRVGLPKWVPLVGALLCCVLGVCGCAFGAQHLRDRESEDEYLRNQESEDRALSRGEEALARIPRLPKLDDATAASAAPLDALTASAAPLMMAAAPRAFAAPAPAAARSEVSVVVKAASEDGTDMEFRHTLKCLARLSEVRAAWARAHGVPESAVGLETCAGQALGTTSTPEELGWEAGSEVTVHAVPLVDDYLGDKPRIRPSGSFKQSSFEPVDPRVA